LKIEQNNKKEQPNFHKPIFFLFPTLSQQPNETANILNIYIYMLSHHSNRTANLKTQNNTTKINAFSFLFPQFLSIQTETMIK